MLTAVETGCWTCLRVLTAVQLRCGLVLQPLSSICRAADHGIAGSRTDRLSCLVCRYAFRRVIGRHTMIEAARPKHSRGILCRLNCSISASVCVLLSALVARGESSSNWITDACAAARANQCEFDLCVGASFATLDAITPRVADVTARAAFLWLGAASVAWSIASSRYTKSRLILARQLTAQQSGRPLLWLIIMAATCVAVAQPALLPQVEPSPPYFTQVVSFHIDFNSGLGYVGLSFLALHPKRPLSLSYRLTSPCLKQEHHNIDRPTQCSKCRPRYSNHRGTIGHAINCSSDAFKY